MRTRSDYYGTNIYEYWIGNKRTAVKKRRGKYYYINSSDINRPMTDSILNVINYRIKKFTKYGVLEMCPTYSHSIVFSSDSKVLPNYIKKMARNINYEVIFKEDFKNENYTGYIKFDNDWFFKIDSIK